MLRRLGIAAFTLIATASFQPAGAQTVLTHHLQKVVRNNAMQSIGKLPADQVMTLDVVLPLRDPAGLDTFIARVSTVGDPLYRHFLNPSEFAMQFGPSQADYDTVVAFLKANGFTVYGGSYLGHEIQVKASVSAVESTFHVTMIVYQHPTEARTFYSPDREPTTDLPFPLWHITGLDNFSIPKPKLVSRDDYAKAHGLKPEGIEPRAGSGGSGPSGSFLGSDMRAAYYGTGTLTGAGQNLGLFEYYGTDLADLTTYFTNAGQTNNVPIVLRSSDGTSTACLDTKAGGDCDDGEQTLDMTQAIGMAPGLANLTMYIGSNDTPILADMVTHYPLPTTIGCSWGWTPADASAIDPYFLQMAAQGQNFFVASGDDSTWKKSGNAEAWPADDANIVAVGGTDLVTASAAGPWASETAWTDSGGGDSPDAVAIPSWQTAVGIITTANGGSTTLRNGPDVSANANFTFYTCGDQVACQANYYGGTSFAAPMWAGYIALVNQQLVANGGSPIGFLNPILYSENLNATTYAADFHDITSGKSGSYTSTAGFDLVTGWGTPTPALETMLITIPSGSADFLLTTPSTAITGSGNLTDTIYATSRYKFAGTVAYTCTAAGGMTCSFTSASSTLASNATGSTTLNIATSGVTTLGTYNVVVTATSGTDVHILTIAVTVNALSSSNFGVSATSTALSPTTTTFTDGITVTGVGTFTGAVNLTCTGAGGITCSLAPTSVTLTAGGTGPSTLTMNSSGVTTSGTYNVVVTGKDAATGLIIQTATIGVTVTIAVPSFTLTNGGAITIATQGAPGSTSLALTSIAAFSGSVGLTCAITSQPTSASEIPTCSVAPSPVSLASGGSGSSTLTINTTAQTLGSIAVKPIAWLAGGLFFSLLLIPARRRRWPMLAVLLTTALLLGNTLACGSSSSANSGSTNQTYSGGTTTGGYVVTVTGTSGTGTSTITTTSLVTLTVN